MHRCIQQTRCEDVGCFKISFALEAFDASKGGAEGYARPPYPAWGTTPGRTSRYERPETQKVHPQLLSG